MGDEDKAAMPPLAITAEEEAKLRERAARGFSIRGGAMSAEWYAAMDMVRDEFEDHLSVCASTGLAEIDALRAALASNITEIGRLNEVLRIERADHEEETALRERLATLLRDVANGLKGPPPPLTRWDWSDLPDLSEKHADLADAVRTLRDSGYDGPFMGDPVAPLFTALRALETK